MGLALDELVFDCADPVRVATFWAKNRVHLDLRPTGSMAAEVEGLKALGATERGFIETDDSFWTQMRDVEGNEFCVLRGPEDDWSEDEVDT